MRKLAWRMLGLLAVMLASLRAGVVVGAADPELPVHDVVVPQSVNDLAGVTAALVSCGADRSVGTAGAAASNVLLARLLEQASGRPVWHQRFTLAVPELDVCWAADPRVPERHFGLWPLTPAGGQPAALAGGGQATAGLVYVGKGTLDELHGKVSAGRWVALDLDSGVAWETLGSLGAKGVIFVRSGEIQGGDGDKTPTAGATPALRDAGVAPAGSGVGVRDFLDKATVVPIGLPRFYTDDPALVAGIKAGSLRELTIRVQVTWREKTAENLLCLLPEKLPSRALSETDKVPMDFGQHLIVVQAAGDACSQVQGRAPGARRAANAAALLLLAQQLRQLPQHAPVLLVLTGGDEWLLHGERQFLELLRPGDMPASAWLQSRVARGQADLEQTRKVVEHLRILAGLGSGPSLTGGALETEMDARAPRQALRDAIDRKSAQIEQELQEVRLGLRTLEAGALGKLNARKQALLNAAAAVTRQARMEESRSLILQIVAEILESWQTELRHQEVMLAQSRQWLEIRRQLGVRTGMIQIGLDLSAGGSAGGKGRSGGGLSWQFGFCARSAYTGVNELAGQMGLFNRALERYANQRRSAPGAAVFNLHAMDSTYTPESYFGAAGARAFATDAALQRGLPAGTFATLGDGVGQGCFDTPYDTVERIDWPGFNQQVTEVLGLLLGGVAPGGSPGLGVLRDQSLGLPPGATGAGATGAGATRVGVTGVLTDPQFGGRSELTDNTSPQSVTVLERTPGETVPRLGAPGHLVGMEQLVTRAGQRLRPLAGMRPFDWAISTLSGGAEFEGLQRCGHRLHALAFDEAGVVRRAQYQPGGGGGMGEFDPDGNQPLRVVVFEAQRLDLFGLFDPRYLDYLDRLELLDARRQDRVEYSSSLVVDGVGAVFMPPGTPWQLLVSKGDIANRMVLINATAQQPQGVGFAGTDLGQIGPLSWRNANDLFVLDAQRKRVLESFGITNQVIQELHGGLPVSDPGVKGVTRPFSGTAEYLDAGRQAEARHDAAGWLASAAAAWSTEISVYNNLQATSNGVIRGVIFLLVGMIPFSYFLERLLIGSTLIYRQIGGFAGIFAVMTGLLWFHPAFRISSAPVMILLAFLILILSAAVMWILLGKFEEEIARLRGGVVGGGAFHTESLQRSAMLGAAVRLGLSNMRRRGVRTALTLVTLILLTFTLLCFTSVREAVRLTPRRVAGGGVGEGGGNPPAGILLRNFGWRTLPPPAWLLVRELAGAESGGGITARRYWYASERGDLPWQLPIRGVTELADVAPRSTAGVPPVVEGGDGGTDNEYIVNGVLGLDGRETLFQNGLPQILPGIAEFAAWPRDDGSPPPCLLASDARVTTGWVVGQEVDLRGQRLRIAGFFDAAQVSTLRHLDGEEFMPVDMASGGFVPPPSGGTSLEGRNAVIEPTYKYLSPRAVVIVPAEIARQMGGRLTSVMIRPVDVTSITSLAEQLARRSSFTIYASDGTYASSFNAAAASSTENLDQVLVPMLLAGVIILNTMLGAVAERKREIHVYTSLGLAPAHVGTLFLAEAAALGTLGVVFGYIFGQGLATILSHFHLMGGVELNYSSISAITTMGLVLGIVMLSSLWPARMAARIAAPALERDWKLPAAHGDVLEVDLPFTVNEQAARGVSAFLEEFLISVSQANTGNFSADQVRAFINVGTVGRWSGGGGRGLTCRVWLAPYDLGVIQRFYLSICQSDTTNVFDIRITLVREAGNPGTWRRLNRPFLVEIRKQFLLWRAVPAGQVQQYMERSTALFAAAVPVEVPAA